MSKSFRSTGLRPEAALYMTQMLIVLRFVPFILIVVLFAGCVHTTIRSLEVRGRVLDAHTHNPLQGAKIFLTDHPNVSCETDSAGAFLLKETHNFHLGSIPPEGDWPQREYWEDRVTISLTNYILLRVDHWPVEKGSDKGDIFLTPRS